MPEGDLASGPRVKGLAFHTNLRQVEVLCGNEVAARALALLPANVREALDGGAVATAGWYPIEWYREVWRAIVAASGKGHALVREIGRTALLEDVSRVHRAILKLLSPKNVASLGARYFNRFYDTGGFSVRSADDRKIAARFEGCTGFDRNMWIEVAGSIEAFVELAGVRGVSVNVVAGGHDGDDWADIVARWK